MTILVKSSTAPAERNRWGTQWRCFYDACRLTGYRLVLDVCASYRETQYVDFVRGKYKGLLK